MGWLADWWRRMHPPTSPPIVVTPLGGILKWGDDFHGVWADWFSLDRSRWSGYQDLVDGKVEGINFNGTNCLRCKAFYGDKACLLKEELGFKAGLDFWCSFPFWLESGAPASNVPIMDLENSILEGNPGRRIFFKQDFGQPLHLILEGKRAGATFRQPEPVEFPRDRWVQLKVRYWLNADMGAALLWQDGQLVCSGMSKILPDVDQKAIYDRVSFGITKNDSRSPQVAYVGAVKIGQLPGEVA